MLILRAWEALDGPVNIGRITVIVISNISPTIININISITVSNISITISNIIISSITITNITVVNGSSSSSSSRSHTALLSGAEWAWSLLSQSRAGLKEQFHEICGCGPLPMLSGWVIEGWAQLDLTP